MPNMGVNTLKNNLTNPARVYLFEILIPNPVGGGDSDVLRIRGQSSQIPGRSVGEILLPYKQTGGAKYPGKLTFSHTWDCTFIEGEDKKIFSAIQGWNQKVVDAFEGIGDGDENIKRDTYLTLLTTKGELFMKIKLSGAYPQNVGDVALDWDTEDAIRYAVTFSYDYWEENE